MPKKFKIPLGTEKELTRFPWMTNTVTLLSIFPSSLLSNSTDSPLGFIFSGAVYLLCLLTMHFNFCRMLYFVFGGMTFLTGIWLGVSFKDETNSLIPSMLLIGYALITLGFGYANFRRDKASL